MDVFSSNFFNDFPNLFTIFVDDDCGVMRVKFEENDMSCQFISNCGSLVFLLLIVLFLKGITAMLTMVVTDKGKLMTKLGIRVYQFNSMINLEFFIQVMDMFQLDFYLAIFLQLDKFEVRSSKSAVNIFAALLFFIGMTFIKVILYFKSTRIAIIKKNGQHEEKGYKKNYFSYLFLSEENHGQNYYSHHQEVLNLIKDPILAVFLVFCSKSPMVQIGAAFVITFLFFMLEVKYRPSNISAENTRNMISNGIYALTNLLFLILYVTEGKITKE